MNLGLGNLEYAIPEIFLACAAMFLLMVGVFRRETASTAPVSWLGVGLIVVTGILVLVFMPPSGSGELLFAKMFRVDFYRVFMKILILAASAVGLIMAESWNEREGINRFEFPVLILLATLGMMMMVSSNDLISLYIGLELQSLSLYVIAAFRRDSLKSSEAGLKYFVLGALASGMLLYGASMVYGFAGSTNFEQLATVLAGDSVTPGIVVGMVFILVGLAFKVSAFPFHMWTPDVYEGAPTSVTAYFAAAPKMAAMALLVSVLVGPFGKLVVQWQQIMILVSLGSMILGAYAAISQTNIKRLLAYSSIGNVGYALIGLAAGTPDGYRGVLVYMAIYLATTLGTFACILCMRRDGRSVEEIKDLAGVSRARPGLAILLALFMFSMAGIPPLAGFFGKLYVFLAAVESELYLLAIIGVLTSVVAAFYYLRVIKVMYFDEPTEALDTDTGRSLGVVQVVAGILVLFFFLVPGPLIRLSEAAIKSLGQL